MIKRIFIRSLIISIAGIFIFALCTSIMLYNIDKTQYTNTLLVYLRSISTFANLSGNYQSASEQIASVYGNTLRVTILDLDGNVLADSEVNAAEMENHKNRAEIIDAIIIGEGSSVRYSATTHQNVLYAAVRIDRFNIIIRGMFPIKGIFTGFLSLFPYVLLSAFIAFIFSVLLAKRLARDTLDPLFNINESILKMSREDFSVKLPYSKYDELNSLVSSVNLLSKEISSSLALLYNEKEKLNFILDNLIQGVVLIDKYYGIIHCNHSTFRIFNLNDKSAQTLFQLTRNNKIINAIESALKNKSSKFDMPIKEAEEIYSVIVLPLNAKNYENTVLILLANVTQTRNNEKNRKEFFSNASHELRTPVTSIMGFSELIINEDNAQDIKEYANIINKESKKLSEILDAILTISALEEHSPTKTAEKTDICEVLNDISNEIKPLCASKNISLHLSCDNILLQISKIDFVSVINNLVDNAVKYGKENGNIWINVEKENDSVSIEIKDDGIGISKTDLPRIFERFYRTEKSRDIKIKGSGIGLAIVKHIIMKYGAEIDVDSVEGAGTTFTIRFDNL